MNTRLMRSEAPSMCSSRGADRRGERLACWCSAAQGWLTEACISSSHICRCTEEVLSHLKGRADICMSDLRTLSYPELNDCQRIRYAAHSCIGKPP